MSGQTDVVTDLNEDAVAYAGVLGQAELLRSGRLTAPQLVDILLTRIHKHEPVINAFRVVREDAVRAEALEAQAARDAGDTRPLLGVPFAVKDNIDVAGETTEHGTLHRGVTAPVDSEQVRSMRGAGMVCIGKTTMPELALWPFGENRATGITRNPWDTSRTSGGSSSGSAAAVAAGFVPVATATDGGGSIRIPAACSGLVGFKPAAGWVSGDPQDHWHGLSSAGVLTRTVTDTAAVLDACAEQSPGLLATLDEPLQPGLQVAWTDRAPTRAPLDDDMRAALDRARRMLEGLGAVVARRDPAYGSVMPGAFVPRYLAGVAEDADTVVPTRRLLEKRTRRIATMGRLISPKRVARARQRGEHLRLRIESQYADVDVLLMPTISRPAMRAGILTHSGYLRTARGVSTWVPFCAPWNALSLPAVSVPLGLSKSGLPLAVQLVARRGSEGCLLRVAKALEDERGPAPYPAL